VKITKFVHSCLLVEVADRTAIFDPGMMSESALDVDKLEFLDDIIITHNHADHFSVPLIKKLVAKFPQVHITAPQQVVDQLAQEGITASSEPSEGVVFFDSPHENVKPLFPEVPEEIGVHYLDTFTDPGDSHSFHETKAILALPVQAPWGSTVNAIKLAIELKPQFVIPIHDWHWSDVAREQLYGMIEKALAEHNITFYKMQTGEPVVIDI
jgi:L-ascorbate metabolism protein UlaG (beta-lactamase superfamily)